VDKALQEKLALIVTAEGEAKSAQLVGESIQSNPAFLTLRKVEAARTIAHTVANSQNKVYLNAESLLLDVNEHKSFDYMKKK
jgi:prohibitin 2